MGIFDLFKGKDSERTEIFEVEEEPKGPTKFIIDEVYMVQGFPVIRGRVLSGRITKDSITVIKEKTCGVAKIQANRQELREVVKGEQCAMILTHVNKYSLRENQILEFH